MLKCIPATAIAASTQDESEKWQLLNASGHQAKSISTMKTEINLCLAVVVVNRLVSPVLLLQVLEGDLLVTVFCFLPSAAKYHRSGRGLWVHHL